METFLLAFVATVTIAGAYKLGMVVGEGEERENSRQAFTKTLESLTTAYREADVTEEQMEKMNNVLAKEILKQM